MSGKQPQVSGENAAVPHPGSNSAPNVVWRLALGAAAVIQLIVLYLPQGVGGPQVAGMDKVVHVLIFAAPALIALRAGVPARWALGILALHAPVSELVQHFWLPQRSGDVLDAVADLGGVAAGLVAYLVWRPRHS